MKKKVCIFAMILCTLCVILVGCNTEKFGITENRYEVVSYDAEAESNIKYSATDGTYNYYTLLVASIYFTPIAWQSAIYYDGTSPITLEFSKSMVTESVVKTSVTSCITKSLATENTNESSFTPSLEIGGKNSPISLKFEKGWQKTNTNSSSVENSTTNTFESAQSEASSVGENFTCKIGENKEKIGQYRFALFATVDVYLCLKLDKENSTVVDTVTSVIARPDTYKYLIDYDPDKNGTFEKTSDSESLKIDPNIYKNLPQPENSIEESHDDNDAVPGNKTEYAGGFGTEKSPYIISSRQHFINMLKSTSPENHFKQICDIKLGDWTEYGISNWGKNQKVAPAAFSGVFDGGNNVVTYSVLIGKTSLMSWGLGLFPTTKSATLKNIIAGVDIRTYDPQNRNMKWDISNDDRAVDVMVGGIVGYANDTSILDCSTNGKIRYNSDGGEQDTCVGGIVGFAANCKAVARCSSSASLYARGFFVNVGGIISAEVGSNYQGLSFSGSLSADEDWFMWGTTDKDNIIARKNFDVL